MLKDDYWKIKVVRSPHKSAEVKTGESRGTEWGWHSNVLHGLTENALRTRKLNGVCSKDDRWRSGGFVEDNSSLRCDGTLRTTTKAKCMTAQEALHPHRHACTHADAGAHDIIIHQFAQVGTCSGGKKT